MTIPVLVDTDCNIDDWLAIGYLLGSNVDIVGITTTGVGMAHLTAGTGMMVSFLSAIGGKASQIPVIPGTNAPLSYSNVYPWQYRQAADQGFGLGFQPPALPPQGVDAADFIYKTAVDQANAGAKLSVLAIGGATNLAIMLQRHADALSLLEQIVFMGGALKVTGNVNAFEPNYANTSAEWNFFVDPVAASNVIPAAGTSLTLVPLDFTNHVPLNQAWVDTLNAQATSNTAKLLGKALNNVNVGTTGYFFWDPLAAAVLASSVATTDQQNVIVITELNEEMDNSGAIVPVYNGGGSPITVATTLTMSVDDFQKDFIATLNAAP